MNITNRTKISLSQLLNLVDYSYTNVLFEKHNIDEFCQNIEELKDILLTNQEKVIPLLFEVIRTKQTLKNMVTSKTSFNQQWEDLNKCLLLDGYKINNDEIITIEPSIEGVIVIEDDLTKEISESSLSKKDDIIRLINESANAFQKVIPDYNECLSKARISLETMVRNKVENDNNINESWGRSLNQLKLNGFLTIQEEQSISATYTFVSDGSHIPLGFTAEEYSRYGRNLIMTVCYYIIKKQNSTNSSFDF
jgi:hypothetical protein